MASTSWLLVSIVKLCFQAEEWALLNEHIFMLTKRRSQLKLAVASMVEERCTFIDQMPDKETILKFIESLRNITVGKVNNS